MEFCSRYEDALIPRPLEQKIAGSIPSLIVKKYKNISNPSVLVLYCNEIKGLDHQKTFFLKNKMDSIRHVSVLLWKERGIIGEKKSVANRFMKEEMQISIVILLLLLFLILK
jgi:hypothetical protein